MDEFLGKKFKLILKNEPEKRNDTKSEPVNLFGSIVGQYESKMIRQYMFQAILEESFTGKSIDGDVIIGAKYLFLDIRDYENNFISGMQLPCMVFYFSNREEMALKEKRELISLTSRIQLIID